MLEQASIVPCDGHDAGGVSAPFAGNAACTARDHFNALIFQAAEFFAGQYLKAGKTSELAAWLAYSPCHRCAWRRVNEAWRLLEDLPLNARD